MEKLLEYLKSETGKNLTESDIRGMNPLVLAYIGDTVYDLFVRSYLAINYQATVHQLHRKAIDFVKAKAQSRTLGQIDRFLTEEEKSIVRRGRNAKSGTIPKNADVGEYRRATGFESLLGYLYLAGRMERLTEIMGYVLNTRKQQQGGI